MKVKTQSLVRPVYNLAGTVGTFLFALSFFAGERTTDLHFHDTYFVVATGYILLLLGCYFLFIWIVYQRLRKRRTWPTATAIHVLTSLFVVAALFVFSLVFPVRSVDYSTFRNQNMAVSLLAMAFLLAQALFLFNAFGALLRKKNDGI